MFEHAYLSLSLAASIDVQWRTHVALDVVIVLQTIEDEIRRECNQRQPVALTFFREANRTSDVLAHASFDIAFSFVNTHVTCGVDDGPRIVTIECTEHGVSI